MKAKNGIQRQIKGDGFIAEVNRIIKQKEYISTETSDKMIPLKTQTSL